MNYYQASNPDDLFKKIEDKNLLTLKDLANFKANFMNTDIQALEESDILTVMHQQQNGANTQNLSAFDGVKQSLREGGIILKVDVNSLDYQAANGVGHYTTYKKIGKYFYLFDSLGPSS
jgi:hypothetical protein